MIDESEIWHILPREDLKAHVEKGLRCWCKPEIKKEDYGTFVIHNSADGREFYEQAEAIGH